MSTQPSGSLLHSNEIIRQLEEAAAQATKWVTAYQDSCVALNTCHFLDASSKSDLLLCIDKNLRSTRLQMKRKLRKARFSLLRAKNNLAPRLHALPRELIMEIFTYVVKDDLNIKLSYNGKIPAKQPATLFYHQLEVLQRVCTSWREIICSTRGLWSTVPLIAEKGCSHNPIRISQNIRDRVAQCPALDLVVHFNDSDGLIPTTLEISEYITKIRTVRMCTTKRLAFKLLSEFNTKEPLHLSELSICLVESRPGDFVNHQTFGSLKNLLPSLQNSLRVLQMRGVNFTFGNDLRFSHLTQLRIQNLNLADYSGTQNLLSAIRSAPFLRTLEIISVVVLFKEKYAHVSPFSPRRPIVLPCLEDLYLEDLYLDLTNIILHSITSSSHRLILNVTQNIFHVKQERGPERVDSLNRIFHSVDIYALVLRTDQLVASEISQLLSSMNQLQELYLTSRRREFHPTLVPWTTALSNPNILIPPKLYLIHVIFNSLDELVSIINSRPIRHLTLGGLVGDPTRSGQRPIQSTDEAIVWVKAYLPSFSLVSPTKTLSEFSSRMWRSWE